MKLSQKQIEAVTALPGPKRYSHFIKMVADCSEVWGLYNDGWALAGRNDDNTTVLPVWPNIEYAQLCAKNYWEGFKPKSIEIFEFIDVFVPELSEEGILVCVFYLANDKGVIPTTEQLIEDLKEELAKYEFG